jgi:poly-gamma-glutamate synthesis protein (capsule biosynthesis protein)
LLISLVAPPAAADEGLTPLALLDGPTAAAVSPAPEPHAEAASVVPAAKPPSPKPARTLTITLGGDLGLNAHGAPVEAEGARRHGTMLGWEALTAGIRPLLDGDINFANLETVVTDRNDLQPEAKAFNFRSHPAGVRHLAAIGFNLISSANNHAIDYGLAGLAETMAHLEVLQREGRILAHAGVGATRRAAGEPRVLVVQGVEVAFAALGIDSGGRAGPSRPGIMAWRAPEDVADVIERLGRASAGYRILSVHQGQERDVTPDRETIRKLRHDALLEGGIDLVVGHHAHVVQGVEITDGRLVFYGLGNLLHPGMQNMGVFGICQDWGLVARLHLAGPAEGRIRLRAVEAIPLTDMHWTAKPLPPERAAERIHVLNHLAAGLDHATSGARGLRFAPQADGSGLHCEPGADAEPGRVGSLCKGFAGVPATPGPLRARIAAACGEGAPVLARRTSPDRSGARQAAPQPASSRPRPPGGWLERVFGGN